MRTIGTLFSGGGGVDIGAIAAGLRPVWAIEYDPAIAGVYRQNLGDHVTVADILALDPLDFEPVDVLHASPPCPNFSNAKAGAQETEHDIALGRQVARFVAALRPATFTMENVYGYRKARSFRIIVEALAEAGYQYRWWHLNAADYGVPQTRRRLILVARLDGAPVRPEATHRDPASVVEGQPPLFGDALPPWVGWYAAIEDLIPSLPESRFANWQLARLPEEMRTLLVGGANTSEETAAPGVGVSELQEPTRVIAGNSDRWRAFIVDGKLNDNSARLTMRDGDAPSVTVTTSHNNWDARAFLVHQSANITSGAPIYTGGEEPATVVRTKHNHVHRAYASSRVVQMTPRALARFQSFPDSYALPESNRLSCKIIGNAVPPLLYQRVIEAQLR